MRDASTQTQSLIVCDYCGRQEPLPAELHARASYLRERLAQLQGAKTNVSQLVFGLGSPSSLFGTLLYLGFVGSGLMQIRYSVLNILPHLPFESRPEQFGQTVGRALPIMLLGLALFVLHFGLYRYSRYNIRPALQANPPPMRGGQPRCRCCGATLPSNHNALLDCAWCGAQNWVTASLARAKALSMEELTRRYTSSYQQLTDAMQRIQRRSQYLIYGVCFGGGIVYVLSTPLFTWLYQQLI